VQLLLDSCDRGDPVQARDYAILMLVARLGLRSIEVRDCSWVTSTGAATGSFCAARQPVKTGRPCWPTSARRWPGEKAEVRPIPLGFFARVVAAADVKTTTFRRRARTDAQADSCAS